MFIGACRSNLRKPVSIKRTKHTRWSQVQNFVFRKSTIHTNTKCTQTTTPLCNHCHDDGVVQQPPLPQQTFCQLLHIMHPVDPVLKDIPRCCRSPDSIVAYWVAISLGDELWHFSVQQGDCHFTPRCTMGFH